MSQDFTVKIDPPAGMSAYELWLSQGNTGDLSSFLNQDVAGLAIANAVATAQSYASQALTAALTAGAYTFAYSTTLPKGVTALSNAAVGTGSGGTASSGPYAFTVTGGPAGHAASYFIGSDGKVSSVRIDNPGVSVSSTAPTYAYQSGAAGGNITGATVPVATVGSIIPVQGRYWTDAGDGINLARWYNNGTATPQKELLADGLTQMTIPMSAYVQGLGTQIALKADDIGPFDPLTVKNAITAQYPKDATTLVPNGQGSTGSAVASYVFNAFAKAKYGEKNVLQLTDTANAAGNLRPVGGWFISPAQLAAIGVTPNDTTPPTISIQASMYTSGMTNLDVDTTTLNPAVYKTRFFIQLRYSGAGGTQTISYPPNNDPENIVFVQGTNGANSGYAGSTDPRWTGIAESGYVNGDEICVARKGIPIPATFNGKALTGVVIVAIGKALAAGPVKMHVGKCTVVAGNNLDVTKQIYNPSDSSVIQLRLALLSAVSSIALNTTALASKVTYLPPMITPTYINAIRGRFTATSSVTAPHGAQAGSAATNVGNKAFYLATGEPNVMQLNAVLNGTYRPCGGYVILPSDLAAIGVVPDDTTPPKISLMGGILAANQVNQTAGSLQMWTILRYGGTQGAIPSYGDSTHDIVLTNTGSSPHPSYAGGGDSRFTSTTGRAFTDSQIAAGWARENVSVPATFNGIPLTAIILLFFGFQADNTLTTGQFQVGRAACIAGATIDTTKTYLNDNDLVTAAAGAASSSNTRTLTIANSEKVGFNGDSYSESIYSPYGKCWISKVGMFTDWPVRNFGTSGDWWEAMTFKLRSNYTYNGQPPQDAGIVHMVGMSETNEPSKNTLDESLQNASVWVDTARSLGMKPYLATEWVEAWNTGYSFALRNLAEQKNVGFIDVRQSSRNLGPTQYSEFYGSGHPGVRTNELISGPMDEFIASIGRPRQAIKMFRKRPGVAVSTVDDLLYSGEFTRAQNFVELTCGQRALTTSDNSQTKYDRLASGTYTTTGYTDEYRSLENGGTISVQDYALIEGILDVQQKSLSALTLTISDPAATVYVKTSTAQPYPSNTLYQGFTMAADPGISVGATYTSNEGNTTGQTFTFVGYAGGKAIFSPRYYQGNGGGSGVLTKTGGTGPASVNFTAAGTAFDLTYYSLQGKVPGHWLALTGSGGQFALTGAALQGILDFDKVSFLVYKAGGAYSLGQPTITYTADRFGKPEYFSQDYRKRATGASLLSTNNFVTGLSGWTTEGSPQVVSKTDSTPLIDPPSNPLTGFQMPSAVVISQTDKVRQSLNFTAAYDRDREIEVRVWPRFYPVENAGTITIDSFDWRQIKIEIINTNNAVIASVTKRVGLWWRDVCFRTVLPPYLANCDIRISAVSDPLQLAWVDVKLV